MTTYDPHSRRRGHGEGGLYLDRSRQRWYGVADLGRLPNGKRDRRKTRACRTKTEAREELRKLRRDIEAGVKTSARYTVDDAVRDWLTHGLSDKDPKTVGLYRSMAKNLDGIGSIPLVDLKAQHVSALLSERAKALSTRSVKMTHDILRRSITHAEANDRVGRNVAALVGTPRGTGGRPSKSLTLAQAIGVLDAAKGSRFEGYIILSVVTGARTEELRALRWADVDMDEGTISVITSVRASGDTKTEKSRRTLALTQLGIDALKAHQLDQARQRVQAGKAWQENNLVFPSTVGTPLTSHAVNKGFKEVTEKAGLGREWSPRELRHSFVSIMSDNDVDIRTIADLAGHSTTKITEQVYRHQLRPVLRTGAEVMDGVLKVQEPAK